MSIIKPPPPPTEKEVGGSVFPYAFQRTGPLGNLETAISTGITVRDLYKALLAPYFAAEIYYPINLGVDDGMDRAARLKMIASEAGALADALIQETKDFLGAPLEASKEGSDDSRKK